MRSILEILKDVGAILPGTHFVGTSGRHLESYVNKDILFRHTAESSEVGKLFAESHKHLDIDGVAGPATGGIILAQWTAHYLSQIMGKNIFSAFAETKDGKIVFRRGYDKLINRERSRCSSPRPDQ